MIERKETRELDAAIRRRWTEWEDRVAAPAPLANRCARWEEAAGALQERMARKLIRGVHAPTRHRAVPDNLASDLNEVAPQALLRDLHRPVTQFAVNELERTDTGWDRGGRGVMREVKEVTQAHYRVPIEDLLKTPGHIRDDLNALREILALKWEDAPKLGFGPGTTEGEVGLIPSIQDEIREAKGWK